MQGCVQNTQGSDAGLQSLIVLMPTLLRADALHYLGEVCRYTAHIFTIRHYYTIFSFFYVRLSLRPSFQLAVFFSQSLFLPPTALTCFLLWVPNVPKKHGGLI